MAEATELAADVATVVLTAVVVGAAAVVGELAIEDDEASAWTWEVTEDKVVA